MAGEPSATDYLSIILRAINKAQNDPAHMRRLVYDLARVSVGRQLLLSYEEIASNGVQRHVSDLETAIKQAEIISTLQRDLLSDPDAAPPLAVSDASAQKALLISEPTLGADDKNQSGSVAVLPSFLAPRDDHKSPLSPQSHQAMTTEFWEAVPRPPKRRGLKPQLLAAAVVGLALYALTLVRPDLIIDLHIPYFSQLVRQASDNGAITTKEPSKPISAAAAATPKAADETKSLGFPLPAVYGVYAVSGGKLYGLQPLAMKVPDPRVAISAMIANPSRLELPDGKIGFIVYRRDLQSNAPDTVPVRVVARVMREMKFVADKPPTTVKIAGEWAIRSTSYQFGVAPIKNEPEMIMLRPRDPQFSFSPGRYALVFKGEGYDFSVAGQVADAAQCLERTDALGGIVYTQCRDAP